MITVLTFIRSINQECSGTPLSVIMGPSCGINSDMYVINTVVYVKM